MTDEYLTNSSAALIFKSDAYPVAWENQVPRKVRLTEFVKSDLPFPPFFSLDAGTEAYVVVNSHGAVSAIMPDDQTLGLKPDEFEVLEWH